MNDKDKEKDVYFKKAKLFKEKGILAHITIKGSGKWLNGKIVTVKSEFLEIDDKEEDIYPVFYDEIHKLEKKKKKRGDGE